MADVNASIHINIDSSNATGSLAGLQAQLASLNKSMVSGAGASRKAQLAQAAAMGQMLNRSGMWSAAMTQMQTATGRMAAQFDKGTVRSFQEYRKNSKAFSRDHAAINQLAAQRVRALQTQYMALGKEVDGTQKVMKMQPTGMMREWGADAQFAQQKAILFRRNLEMGANSMVNWGKNTQWAGRQMMVGMGIPVALAAAGAVSSFKDIEAASISFKRVYGDATTSVGEKSQMLSKIQSGVAQDMTKYGIAVADTMDVAAKAAATGQTGDDLVASTTETMRLATLGQMDYQTALESTIATQTAFGVKSQDMARVTDFMNAAENQTILSMEDMAKAIPRVAPVIKGLGGDVEDLGVLMTALRSGSISAEQGANALKSGLASLINPTSSATEAMDSFGIPLEKIVNANKGDLIGTVQDFGKALSKLPKFEQQQALESLFGKYQFARMGALFKNINSRQAKEAAKLSKASSATLAKMSEQEMGQIADSSLTKWEGAIERLKAAVAPLGKTILDSLAPLVDITAKVAGFFATNDVARNVGLWAIAFAGLAGVATMITGVFANFFGTMTKGAILARRGMDKMMGRSIPRYSSIADLEASAAQRQLGASAESAAAGLYAEAGAARVLSEALAMLKAEQAGVIANNGKLGGGGAAGVLPKPGSPVAPGGKGAAAAVTPGVVPNGASVAERAVIQRGILADERTHLGGMNILSESQVREIQQRAGLSKDARDILARAFDPKGQFIESQVSGRNSRTMYVSHDLNKALMNGTASGADILSDLSQRGRDVSMAPTAITAARNMGMTNAAANDWVRSADGQRFTEAVYGSVMSSIDPSKTYHDSDLDAIAEGPVRAAIAATGDKAALEAWDKMGQITDIQAYDPNAGDGGRLEGKEKAAVGRSGLVRPPRDSTEEYFSRLGLLDDSGLPIIPKEVPALSAAQERGAVVIDASNEAERERAKAVEQETGAAARSTKAHEASLKSFEQARTANTGLHNSINAFGKSLVTENKATGSGGLWGRMRQGGAFTGDSANKWSNRLFGMGMAADMVTWGLSAMGKDMPAWSHMIGMGAMTLGTFPGLIGKPLGALGGLVKGATMPALSKAGAAIKTFGSVAAVGASELMGLGSAGVIGGGLAGLSAATGGVLAAFLAAGAAAWVVKSTMDRASDAGIELAKTYTLSGDAVEAYAQEVGKESATAKEKRKAIEDVTGEKISAAEMEKRNAQLQTQSGQLMLANAKKAMELGGPANVIDSITGQVGKLFSEGLVGQGKALDLATTLGSAAGLDKQQMIELRGVIKDVTGLGIGEPIPVDIKPSAVGNKLGKELTDRESLAAALGEDQANRSNWTKWIPNQDEKFLAGNVAQVAKDNVGFGYQDAVNQLMDMPGFSPEQQNLMINDLHDSIWDQYRASGADARLGPDFNEMLDEASVWQFGPDRERLRAGASQIRLSAAQGDIGDKALQELFNGSQEMQKQVLLTFAGADGQSVHAMNSLLGEQNKDGSMSSNASDYMNALKNADTEQKRAQIAASAKEYAALPEGRKNIDINFQTQGPEDIAKLKGIAQEINSLPDNIQKRVNIAVEPGQEGRVRSLMKDVDAFSEAAPGKTRKAIDSLAGGQINNLGELKKVIGYLNQLKSKGDIKLNVKTDNKDLDKKPKSVSQKVTRTLGKDGTTKKPKALKQLINRSIGKDGSIKRPKTLSQLINRILGKDGSKKNPGALRQIVARLLGVDETEVSPKQMEQMINRLLGQRDDNLTPDTLPQTINRLLGGRGDLADPPTLTQTINRIVKGAGAVVGAAAAGIGGSTGGPVRLAGGGPSSLEPLSRAKFAGTVSGPGGPKDDLVPAWLSNGEFVMRAASVKKYGLGFMHDVNAMRLGKGGNGKDKDPKDSDKKDSDKWTWKKDVMKPYRERVGSSRSKLAIVNKAGNNANKSKLYAAALEQLGDDPKALKAFKNKSASERKKFAQKLIAAKRREQKAEQMQEWQSFLDDAKITRKATKARLKAASDFRGKFAGLALNLDDTEASKLATLKKGKQRKKFLQQAAQRAKLQDKLDIATRTQELVSEAKYNSRTRTGKLAGLNAQAFDTLSQEDYNRMMKLSGKELQRFTQSLNAAANASETAAQRLVRETDEQASVAQSYRDQAAARADAAIANQSILGQQRTPQGWEDWKAAQNIVLDDAQHNIDEINKAYDEQAKILDKVEATQQSIANIERARLSVGGSLSSGDVAGAAAAMQEARQTQAQFAQEQMRAGLEAERQARIDQNQKLIDAINENIRKVDRAIAVAQKKATDFFAKEIASAERIAIAFKNTATYWKEIRRGIQGATDDTDPPPRPPGGLGTPVSAATRKAQARKAAGDKVVNEISTFITDNLSDSVRRAVKKSRSKKDDKAMHSMLSHKDRAKSLSGKLNEAIKDKDADRTRKLLNKLQAERKIIKHQYSTVDDIQQKEKKRLEKKKKQAKEDQKKKAHKKAYGGWVGGKGTRDTVPHMLTPGEFVVNRLSAKRFGGVLEQMNGPRYKFAGAPGMAAAGAMGYNSTVNNTVTVNAYGSDAADANKIADTVVRRIDGFSSGNIRRRDW